MSAPTGPGTGPDIGSGAADDDIRSLIDRLRLLYQPIVRLADTTIAAVEVLARVLARDETLHGPESLLAAMNATAASMALSSAIVSRGLAEQAAEAQGDWNGLQFSFNLPLDAILHPNLIDIVEGARGDRLAASQIVFELTERHPVHDVAELGAVVRQLEVAGYGTALDDVVPDTPNLEALMDLPFRAIKLDRGVVIDDTPDYNHFIRHIVASAELRHQAVIAEGIETPDVLHRMSGLGVSHGQGFLLARPMPAAALSELLAGWSQRELS